MKPDLNSISKNEDPDQLASSHASLSGSTLFSLQHLSTELYWLPNILVQGQVNINFKLVLNEMRQGLYLTFSSQAWYFLTPTPPQMPTFHIFTCSSAVTWKIRERLAKPNQVRLDLPFWFCWPCPNVFIMSKCYNHANRVPISSQL